MSGEPLAADDYKAVVFDGEVRCIECLPPGIDVDTVEVEPIFAAEEWDEPAICTLCATEHDYMKVA